jgi:hypothetical protein
MKENNNNKKYKKCEKCKESKLCIEWNPNTQANQKCYISSCSKTFRHSHDLCSVCIRRLTFTIYDNSYT